MPMQQHLYRKRLRETRPLLQKNVDLFEYHQRARCQCLGVYSLQLKLVQSHFLNLSWCEVLLGVFFNRTGARESTLVHSELLFVCGLHAGILTAQKPGNFCLSNKKYFKVVECIWYSMAVDSPLRIVYPQIL